MRNKVIFITDSPNMFGFRPVRKLAVSENPLSLPNSAARPLFDDEVEVAKDEVDALFGDRC